MAALWIRASAIWICVVGCHVAPGREAAGGLRRRPDQSSTASDAGLTHLPASWPSSATRPRDGVAVLLFAHPYRGTSCPPCRLESCRMICRNALRLAGGVSISPLRGSSSHRAQIQAPTGSSEPAVKSFTMLEPVSGHLIVLVAIVKKQPARRRFVTAMSRCMIGSPVSLFATRRGFYPLTSRQPRHLTSQGILEMAFTRATESRKKGASFFLYLSRATLLSDGDRCAIFKVSNSIIALGAKISYSPVGGCSKLLQTNHRFGQTPSLAGQPVDVNPVGHLAPLGWSKS